MNMQSRKRRMIVSSSNKQGLSVDEIDTELNKKDELTRLDKDGDR